MSGTYEYIVNLSRDLISLIDRTYRYTLVNDAYCRQMERPREEIVGSTVADIWGDDVFETIIRPNIEACLSGEAVEYIDTFPFGRVHRHMRVHFYPFAKDGEEITHCLVISEDITVLAEVEERLSEYEFRDQLTGLYNRNTMDITLEQQVAVARRHPDEAKLVLLFVSLHNFKSINRTHGHQIGDFLLADCALRLSECLRSSDFVFRFDSANFVVLLTEIQNEIDASLVSQKIHDAIAMPYRLDTTDERIDCRIGIAVYPKDADGTHTLLQRANSACIEAEDRDEPFLFYDDELHRKAVSRGELHSQLKRAFENDEFELYFQPIVDISEKADRVAGAEALIRWNHPVHGMLSPDTFIALAEQTNVVRAIDKWVIFSICDALSTLSDHDSCFLTANLSAGSFSDAQLAEICSGAAREANGVDLRRLRLELTESVSVRNLPVVLERIEELDRIGIEVWIDDFGVGQSSLAMMKQLPARGIKIDRSFMEDVEKSQAECDYLRSIVASIDTRCKVTIVEGVSSLSRLKIARTLGCRYVQGFYLGLPMPLGEFVDYLENPNALIGIPSD